MEFPQARRIASPFRRIILPPALTIQATGLARPDRTAYHRQLGTFRSLFQPLPILTARGSPHAQYQRPSEDLSLAWLSDGDLAISCDSFLRLFEL